MVLTGVNVGRYTYEGLSLSDVVQELEKIAGLDRIRISSIEPTTISDELLERMVGPSKLCPYLHVPLQSGDDDILNAMNRRYTAREYSAFIEKVVRRVPGVGLGTDVMVGFPGESDVAFANTRALVENLPFAYFHVFSYSPRPRTAAHKLRGAVHAQTIKSRSRALCALSRAKRLGFYQQHVGRTMPVLFESRNRQGLFTGLTTNYIRVGVSTSEVLTNQVRPVRLHGAMDGLALGALADG